MPETLPLVLTRPEAQGRDFAAALAARCPGRFAVIYAPLMEIAPVPVPVDLAGIGGLAFTSANGVRAFMAAVPEGAPGRTAWCVGDLTAAAARAAGLTAVSADGDLPALVALIRARAPRGAGAILHVRGRHAAGDLVAALAAAGLPARAAELYDQRALPLGPEGWAALAAGGVATAFSPRTARLLADAARSGGHVLAGATAVSLSPAADAALAPAGFGRRLVAAHPRRGAMIDCLAGL